MTDDKGLPKERRKELQVEKASSKSSRAKILKLADKTSNLRSLAKSPPADWSETRRKEYVAWAKQVAEGLRGSNDWIEARFDEAAAIVSRVLNLKPNPAPKPHRQKKS